MTEIRKSYTAQEKAKIALEAIKGVMTQNEITTKYGIHSSQIHNWKKRLLTGIEEIFSDKRKIENHNLEEQNEDLHKKIGQLTMELDWLKKKSQLFS
jgi:transposase